MRPGGSYLRHLNRCCCRMDHSDIEYLQEEAVAEGGVPIAAIEI